MRAGGLRHLVSIEAPTRVKDEYGSVTVEWVPFGQAYASIEHIKAFDKAALASVWPGADYTITMRYLAGVNSTMRVVYGGQIFSILGQPNNVDLRNRELVLTCQSGVAAQ